MGRHVDRLHEQLHSKLLDIERHARALPATNSLPLTETIRQIQEQLAQLQERIDLTRERTGRAEVEVLRWIESHGRLGPLPEAPRASGPAGMQRRLTEAMRYADAALDLALAAIDDAEYAAVAALHAEHQMAYTQSPGSGAKEP